MIAWDGVLIIFHECSFDLKRIMESGFKIMLSTVIYTVVKICDYFETFKWELFFKIPPSSEPQNENCFWLVLLKLPVFQNYLIVVNWTTWRFLIWTSGNNANQKHSFDCCGEIVTRHMSWTQEAEKISKPKATRTFFPYPWLLVLRNVQISVLFVMKQLNEDWIQRCRCLKWAHERRATIIVQSSVSVISASIVSGLFFMSYCGPN